jgi:hypothetical protein
MSERKGGAGARAGSASPGMPESAMELRLAELEERLAGMEGGPSMRERGKRMIDRVMPPEASRHFRNAGREQLLGLRSILDFWLRRIEDAEARSGNDNGRETIKID